LCTVLVIVLVVQNAEAVRVNLFFWNIELSMALVIFCVFLTLPIFVRISFTFAMQ
jgi:uncharacterized integral membrane protein